MRNLINDLRICQQATDGPWYAYCESGQFHHVDRKLEKGWEFICQYANKKDAEFIAESREGWQEAIERAVTAETEIVRLQHELSELFMNLLEEYEDAKTKVIYDRIDTHKENEAFEELNEEVEGYVNRMNGVLTGRTVEDVRNY
ncbi:hypothetical protein [Mechercharimyces sp. CAU 1602]|uniref:hypothetical protein n=1 Tax=Mechercharimyces sp. CAU 1602 TaxID=2973933 RepID=UPI002161AD71|nr:hypothetical protein [Mechercharimyces sp. CAU 1602]MCS1350344.1 hypothetical protein [Mechercharimyces sp. CAU 1602]